MFYDCCVAEARIMEYVNHVLSRKSRFRRRYEARCEITREYNGRRENDIDAVPKRTSHHPGRLLCSRRETFVRPLSYASLLVYMCRGIFFFSSWRLENCADFVEIRCGPINNFAGGQWCEPCGEFLRPASCSRCGIESATDI